MCREADSSQEQTDNLSDRSEEHISAPSLSLHDLMEASLNGERDIVQKAADQVMDMDQKDLEGHTHGLKVIFGFFVLIKIENATNIIKEG